MDQLIAELIKQVFGPLGAIALLLIMVIVGGRILWWFIQDLAKQRDLAQVMAREQASATQAVADAIGERNRLEAERMKMEEVEDRARQEALVLVEAAKAKARGGRGQKG